MTILSVITITKHNRKKTSAYLLMKGQTKVIDAHWSSNKYYIMNFKIMLREISHKGLI